MSKFQINLQNICKNFTKSCCKKKMQNFCNLDQVKRPLVIKIIEKTID